jgi:chromosome segregation ATPase
MNSSETSPDSGKGIRKSIALWISLFTGALAVVASIIVFFFSAQQQRISATERDYEARARLAELYKLQDMTQRDATIIRAKSEQMEAQLETARAELARLSARSIVPGRGALSNEFVKQLSTLQTTVENVDSRLEGLDKQSGAVGQRMEKLEAVILADPQKAVELPLIKRDLQAFQQQVDRDLNAAKAENARVYDLMKWLVGLMALVSLSLVGTAVSSVFKREPGKEDRAAKKESDLTNDAANQ